MPTPQPPSQPVDAEPAKSADISVEPMPAPVREVGGPKGPEPTRYGDWEKNGRCIDFCSHPRGRAVGGGRSTAGRRQIALHCIVVPHAPAPSKDAAMSQSARPVSPHLQIYRWQIQMVTSILHRASGIVLSVGAFVLAGMLLALASGQEAWDCARGLLASWPELP